ncbi:MAG: Nif3-like dinuclear metal center hexameric protein [Candidatus Lokiarchaeota archaeon]|nr:Nif3-like dinuclear metal center hexameric protein [Candidatus Lokiarchaeota archaeon]
MFFDEIESIIENKLSPKIYRIDSEYYGLYYGQINSKKHIKKILFTVDLSLKSIHYAVKNKINLIISLNGFNNNPITNFNQLLINKINLLSRYPLLIFILNSTFIAAEGGVSDTIMESLYLKLDQTLNVENNRGDSVPIGRICVPNYYTGNNKIMTLDNLLKRIKSNLEVEDAIFVGDLNSEVKKICIVGENKLNINYLRKALKNECDCYISGYFNHQIASYAKESHLNLIGISLYNCYTIALKKMHNILSLEFPHDDFYFFESRDPINIFN